MKKQSIKRWIVLSFTGILFLSITLSGIANYYEAYNSAMKQSATMAGMFSGIVERLLDHHWELDDPEMSFKSERYLQARKAFRSLCQLFRMEFAYIYKIDQETPSRYYYFYVASDDEADSDLLKTCTLKSVPAEKLYPGEEKLLSGDREQQRENLNAANNRVDSWITPYYDKNDRLCTLIGVDYDTTMIRNMIMHYFFVDIIPFILSLFAGMLTLLVLVQRRIVNPVSELSERMQSFAQDTRKKPEPLKVPVRDEIGEIAKSFEKMTEDISDYTNNIEKLTEEKTEINVQMALAHRIQYGMVPKRTDLNDETFHITAMTRPAKAVGGDFYDCFRRNENCICFFIGDVSGKGISAALYMAMIKTAIREKLSAGLSPADALNQTNSELCAQNPEGLFVTVFAAILNLVSGELLFANAGHNWPVLMRKDVEVLKPEPGIPIGLFEDANIQNETLVLSEGQGIVLYTDGLTEATNPQNEFYGMERLTDTLKRIPRSADPAEEVLLRIREDEAAFRSGCEPFDDTAVLVVFIKGNMSYTEEEQLPIPVSHSSFREIKKEEDCDTK